MKKITNGEELLDRIGWEGIQRLHKQRRIFQKSLKSKGICKVITQAVNNDYNLPVVCGYYRELEHWWNVFPDSSILDASADQFGHDAILVVTPNDPLYADYTASTRSLSSRPMA